MERFDTFLDTILDGEKDKDLLKPIFMAVSYTHLTLPTICSV